MGMATSYKYQPPSYPVSRRGDDPTVQCLPKGKGNCPECGKMFQLKSGKIPKHYRKGERLCGAKYTNGTSLPVK